jgi:hypothetical protein
VSLFNGKDLTGWDPEVGPKEGWRVSSDGDLIAFGRGFGSQGWLLSNKVYSDFILAFEFQAIEAESQGGVCFRALPGETSFGVLFHPFVGLGGVKGTSTGCLVYKRGTSIPPDQAPSIGGPDFWNKTKVQVQGHKLTVSVNGVIIRYHHADRGDSADLGEIAMKPDALTNFGRLQGRVGFFQQIGEVRYRDIKIKELPPAKPSD